MLGYAFIGREIDTKATMGWIDIALALLVGILLVIYPLPSVRIRVFGIGLAILAAIYLIVVTFCA